MSYNTYLQYATNRFAQHIREWPSFFSLVPAIPVSGSAGEDTREVLWYYSNSRFSAYVGDEYDWRPDSSDFTQYKSYTKLIQTDLQYRRRYMAGGGVNLEAVRINVDEKAEEHALIRDELLLSGDSKLPNWVPLGGLVSNANSSINKPSSCETTPGTVEPLTSIKFAGANASVMVGSALNIAVKKLFLTRINTTTAKRLCRANPTITCVIHPIALSLLEAPMFNGTFYLNTSNRQFLESNGWRFVPSILADPDYTGAEDGTTELHCFADLDANFNVGVLKAASWDGWAQTEGTGDWINKLSEIITASAVPFLDDDGYYYKSYAQVQVTGYDNVT